jgi:zinc protease
LKRLGFAVLAGLLLVPSAARAEAPPVEASPAAQATADPNAPVRATLANGMHVVLLRNTLAPVVTTMMSYGVGSDDDTMPGIAHATEHMLFRGTSTLSAGQLADVAARMGAEYNAMTTFQDTLYYYKLPSSYLDVALRIEADRMTHATMRAADWATERGAIEQEIRAQESSPVFRVSTKLKATFFAGTPIATASGGTVASFEKMTAADIAAFYHTWYLPANATLIVAGDIDPEQALARVHAHFDAIPSGTLPARTPIDAPPLASTTVEDSIDFPFGFGVLAYRMPGTDAADYAASQVLATVFQSGRGALGDLSASGKELAVVNVANAFPEIGADFLLAIPARGGTPQTAQGDVAAVLDGYRTTGVPPELVEAAKTRLLSERAYREASITGLGFAWAEATALRRPSPDASYEAIRSVTLDDVNRVLRTYFTPDHRVSIAITAKPSGTTAKVDPSAGVEHVGYVPTVHEPLPAWAQSELKAPLRAPVDETKTIRSALGNGLQYALRRETTSPTVIVRGVIRNSAMLYEPAGKDGVSMILAGLMPWGSTTYDRKAYEAQTDAIAGDIRLGTSFSLKVQAKDFERGMALLADGLLHPALPADGFAVVKAATLQSVGASNKLPATRAALAQRLAMYPQGDPHRRDVTERTVSAVTLDAVTSYYKFAYRPDETTMVIVGDVSPERARTALATAFGSWKATGKPPSFLYRRPKAHAEPARTVTVKSATNAQSEVTLTQLFHMSRADADYVPLLLANTMLSGEGTGSLLFEELRTRLGYVYTADSNFHVDLDGAEFSVSFASDPKNVKRANAAVVAMIKRLQTHPLAAVELQRAKALLLAQRVLPLDSYGGLAADMLSGAEDGYASGGSERWFWTALLRTTPAEVEHALRRVDPSRFTRVIVEPDR